MSFSDAALVGCAGAAACFSMSLMLVISPISYLSFCKDIFTLSRLRDGILDFTKSFWNVHRTVRYTHAKLATVLRAPILAAQVWVVCRPQPMVHDLAAACDALAPLEPQHASRIEVPEHHRPA